ncbi:MAG: flagellar filament outer layer protein FlaA [bacterium]|nr:flagellar filament outer layer protein FlaA [bacterium]
MKGKIITIIIVLLLTQYSFAGGEEYRSTKKIISIQAPALADFEDQGLDGQWVIGNTSPNVDMAVTAVKATPGGPWGLAVPEDQKKTCLGVKTGFRTRGYNFVEILPPVYDAKSYSILQNYFNIPIPNSGGDRFIPIPGKCKSLDVWVAGRGFRYNFEVWLKDFNGFVYSLDMGKLDFPGWRNLSRDIPQYIPQEEKYFPREKPLKFVKYVLVSDPDERADKFFIYFDHMKVITDVYIERIDGDDIRDNW